MNHEKLHKHLSKMQKESNYREFIEDEKGVHTDISNDRITICLFFLGTEWVASNGSKQATSSGIRHTRVLFAETANQLFMPQADKTALYIAPVAPAMPCCSFAYFAISNNEVQVGFVAGKTSGEYRTDRAPLSEDSVSWALDMVLTIVGRAAPEEVERLHDLFNISK